MRKQWIPGPYFSGRMGPGNEARIDTTSDSLKYQWGHLVCLLL